MDRYVSYYRVSTQGQGVQGLGMEAQRQAVSNFLKDGSKLVGEFEEIESGKRSDRPALMKAIALCQKTGATLLIAKLDRLSRDAHFLLGLDKQGVDFIACDMPMANRTTVGIMAVIAEAEREAISSRTKAGLAVIKAKLEQGETHISKAGKPVTRLGNPNGMSPDRAALGRRILSDKADQFADKIAPTAWALREAGMTFQEVAERLNEMAVRTPRGKQWGPTSVKRIIERTTPRRRRKGP